MSYQKSVTNPVYTKNGYALETFNSLAVAGTGGQELSYDTVAWSTTKDGTATSATTFYYVHGEAAGNIVVTDTSSSTNSKQYFVESRWCDIEGGDEVYNGDASFTVSAETIEGLAAGSHTFNMQSLYTRPVYYYINGDKCYSHKLTDGSDLYQIDLEFTIVVYPTDTDFTAEYALYKDATMLIPYTEKTTGVYEIEVGQEVYMAAKTSTGGGLYVISHEWDVTPGINVTELVEETDYYLDSAELKEDAVKFIPYTSTTTGFIVKYTASDDRETTVSGSTDVSKDASFTINVITGNNALFTAKATTSNQMVLTLVGSEYKFENVDYSNYDNTFVANITAGAGEGYFLRSTDVAWTSDTELTLTFEDQNLYVDETYTLTYNGNTVNSSGDESSSELDIKMLKSDGSASDVCLLKNVPVVVDLTSENPTLLEVSQLALSYTMKDGSGNTTSSNSNPCYITTSTKTSDDVVVTSAAATIILGDNNDNTVTERLLGFAATAGAGISSITWTYDGTVIKDGEFASDLENGFIFSEGASVVTMKGISTRPVEGFTSIYNKAGFYYDISQDITINAYKYDMGGDVSSYTYSTDAALTNVVTLSGDNSDEIALNAGQSLYITNSTFGTTLGISTDGNGSVVNNNKYITFTEAGDHTVTMTLSRSALKDSLNDYVSVDGKTVDVTITVTVDMGDLDFSWAYYTTTSLRITLANSVKFTNTSSLDLTELASCFKVYYGGAEDSSKELIVKSVSFTSGSDAAGYSILQITLNGGTTDKFYSDDLPYLVYTGADLETDDSFGRLFGAGAWEYENYIVDTSGSTTISHLPYTNILTDNSFSFSSSKMSTGTLNYYTSVSACPQGEWTYGNSNMASIQGAFDVAEIIQDPLGSSTDLCLHVVSNKNYYGIRCLYNGTQLTLSSGSSYYASFEYMVPTTTDIVDGTTAGTDAIGNNTRTTISYYIGNNQSFYATAYGAVSPISMSIDEYGKTSTFGQWNLDDDVANTTYTTSYVPRVLNFDNYFTPTYNTICLYLGYSDQEFYFKNFRLERVDTRPKN